MSNNEKMGRCRSEVDECRGSPSELKIADAIDRLAADVAAIKEAVCDGSVAEERDRFLAGMGSAIKERDAAIRERDQWREEARIAVINRDEARAEVKRLKAIVHSDAGHMAKILIENERLRAAPAAPQPAGQGISPGLSDTQPTGNAAPAAGWLTEREQHALRHILAADVEPAIRSLLSRAGSPPVVEVPVMDELDAPARVEARAYRAAMDKAGVKWKEVGRE